MKPLPRNNNYAAWPGAIPLASLYTAGAAGQIFLDALKRQGRLVAGRCRACKRVYLPPRAFCERCFGALTQRMKVKPTGRIMSFTICYVDRNGAPLRRPRALALVQMDGVHTVLLHDLLGPRNPEQITIGSKVEVKIKPKRDRVGSILDIEGFVLSRKAPTATRGRSAGRSRRTATGIDKVVVRR
jgi:uncharacterized protein